MTSFYRGYCIMQLKITNVFECDDLIVDSIIMLNQKGYLTDFCCSGHEGEGRSVQPYVSFTRIGSLEIDLNHIEPPKNWHTREEKSSSGLVIHYSIYRHFTDEEFENNSITSLIELAMEELYSWADSLPNRNFSGIYNNINIEKI